MLGGGKVKELYELKGEGRSIRGIARELGVSRNTVRKYARASGVPKPKLSRAGQRLSLLRDYVRLSAKGKCPPRNLLCYQPTIWSTSVEMAT